MHRRISLGGFALTVLLTIALLGCGQNQQQTDSTSADEHATMNTDASATEGHFAVGPFGGTLPEGWVVEEPTSSMRLAQWALPAAEGDDPDAKVLVFYFGPEAGSVEMNITRWMGQFANADGSPITENNVTRETMSVQDMDVSLVMFSGTQKPSAMMGAPSSEEMPGWMNISAIVMSPTGPWFFKGTGPEATMQQELDAFKQMLNSLEYSEMHAHQG